MKSSILSILAVVFAVLAIQAQPQDNNFQKFYSQVQNVIAKDVESFSGSDLKTLNEAIKIDPNYFGAANQKLVSKMIQDAKSKKLDYDNYLRTKENLSKTKEELDVTSGFLKESEARGDSLYAENVQLKVLIDQLTARINKLDKEAKKLQNINKKFQQENLQTKELLQSSRGTINRILRLLPANVNRNEMHDQLPATLQDSLNQSECQVAELLKNNFLLTLDGLKRDQVFLDSAMNFFKENKVHLPVIDEYILSGTDLVNRFKEIGIPCTSNYASEIEVAITDFKTTIESANMTFGEKFAKFFSENMIIIIPLLLVIIVLIVLLFRKSKK